ncbi:MAG: Cof-type HAD-IIB family hydrolase [Vibrio sp.]
MTYKLLALDLDGTTLQDDHKLNPWVKEYVQRIKEKYTVMIVTGRHHTAAKPYYDEFGLTTPIICCNGVYRYDYAKEKVETGMPIPFDLAQQFLALAHQFELQLVMYTAEGMAFSNYDPMAYMLPLKEWALSYPQGKQPKIYQIDSFEKELEKTACIWKLVVKGNEANFNAFLQQDLIQTHFEGSISGENKIDLAMKGHSKGQALLNYLQCLDLDSKQVVAAGDNYNDISMINTVGCGIAMLHAEEEIKQHAHVICSTDNQGNGLEQILKTYFPI